MKIVEHFDVPASELSNFLNDFNASNFTINYNMAKNLFHFTTQEDYTEPQFRMLTLRTLLNNTALTFTSEETDAIEYAISCIKTLEDMGVIK